MTKTILSFIVLIATAFAVPNVAAETVASGTGWENTSKRTNGDWAIVEEDGIFYVELGENFNTRRAPDLKIYLSTEDAASRGNKNGLENTVFIAELTSNKGAQRYQLPEGTDPADYASLVIYCEAFSVFWAATSI